MLVWCADAAIVELVEKVKQKFHLPRLEEAKIAVCMNDGKPFVGGRFNWGKTQKFSNLAKLWHPKHNRYDFLINFCGDAWVSILDAYQREAWVDLRMSCCQVEYEPVTIEENGVKKPAKDEWGRVQYTDIIKRDDEGIPKWKVVPLDLNVLQENVSRYGCWCADLLEFKEAIDKSESKKDAYEY